VDIAVAALNLGQQVPALPLWHGHLGRVFHGLEARATSGAGARQEKDKCQECDRCVVCDCFSEDRLVHGSVVPYCDIFLQMFHW
jgi:hypothetical protein